MEDPQRLSELEAEVRELRYLLGHTEGRLELVQGAESTLREQLARGIERADRAGCRVEELEARLTLFLETSYDSERLMEPSAGRVEKEVPQPDNQGAQTGGRSSWRQRLFGS